MTEIEKKALALVNEVRAEYPLVSSEVASNLALCRAIEQHEAFRQEVSDAVEDIAKRREAQWLAAALDRFIIPKPVDPLVEALNKMPGVCSNEFDADDAMYLRAALAARGLEIREKQ